MSSKSAYMHSPSVRESQQTAAVSVSPDCSTETLLELLGDEYTRAALEAVSGHPQSGREVSDGTTMSRPTAFRRLNRLESAGLVTTEQIIDETGQQHKRYRSVVEQVSFELKSDGLSAQVTTIETPEQ